MKSEHRKLYYNRNDIYMSPKVQWTKLNENKINPEIIKDFPVNKPIPFDKNKMIKAIQFGMVIMINYRGDKDSWRGGRERVICPMVIGQNRNTKNVLIRGWHLDGWSVNLRKNAKKVWRLFKAVNMKTMMFTGDFFRLPPKGYKRNDRVMTELTFAAADFNVIRRNQFKLVQQGLIEDEEETKIEKGKTISVEIKNTDTMLDLNDVWGNNYFEKKNQGLIKISFMKSIVGADRIAVLGAQGPVGSLVKLYEGRKLMGTYKTLLSLPDTTKSLSFENQIKKYKKIDFASDWKLYTFVKKL
jgi:hypothetical protein